MKNKIIIAAAGAGKTTYLANQALDIVYNDKKANILVTTYTRSNAQQIRDTICSINKERSGESTIPDRIVISEWFTFLLKEGVRPFKSTMHPDLKYKSIGFFPDFQHNENLKRFKEDNIIEHYFVNYKSIPNALAKFFIKADSKSNGSVIQRLQNIYSHIYIDEVQDLAGYDLEIIHELFKSTMNVLLVGDPRQVTYYTHHEKKNSRYKDGKIKYFVLEKCKKSLVDIDEDSLKYSHRNTQKICDFSSSLYPGFEKSIPCSCEKCRVHVEHLGVFLVKNTDIRSYLLKYGNGNFCTLRWQESKYPERNFGDSKGLTFDRVLIYPTKPIIDYLKSGNLTKSVKNKKKGTTEIKPALDIAKFYVAVTRAKYSVAIVYDYKDSDVFIDGVQKYQAN